jgi:hypothetical protein
MSAIKIHLEQAEYDVVLRCAQAMGVTPEDIGYAALNRLMLVCAKEDLGREIVETRDWRKNNLPLWSDSACSVHAYEGKADDEPEPSRLFK